jgi:hypothetical protein
MSITNCYMQIATNLFSLSSTLRSIRAERLPLAGSFSCWKAARHEGGQYGLHIADVAALEAPDQLSVAR